MEIEVTPTGQTTVAVLMTCFNRHESTARCLGSLYAQEGIDDVQVNVYLVDDGCTDGTGQMVRDTFPKVNVLQGSGDLCWCGGTAMAEEAAWPTRPDYLLWLNDDVVLFPSAVRELLDTAAETNNRAVVSGSMREMDSPTQAYGGFVVPNKRKPFDHHRVEPDGTVKQVDTMHGNVVLVPREVRQHVGGLDTRFPHNMSDTDYGYRTRRAGFDVVICRGYVGTCERDPARQAWRDPSVPLRTRWNLVRSKLVFPPRARWAFVRKYCGWRAILEFPSPYVDALFPRRRVHLRWRKPSVQKT